MTTDAGATKPYWTEDMKPLFYQTLDKDLSVDICIVGGGIAGMSVAYMAAQTGLSVAVVEDGAIGGGETGRSTAHLSFAIDDTYIALQKRFGKEGARLAAESHSAAVDKIEAIIKQEHIDCDFLRVNGYYFNPADEHNLNLDEELRAAHESGLTDVTHIPAAPFTAMRTGEALCFPRQGVFHPLKYLSGLANALLSGGHHIFTKTRVLQIEYAGNFTVRTSGASIIAKYVTVATNDPIVKCDIPKKNIAWRSYALGMRCKANTLPMALYWDTGNPYHHIRVCKLNDSEDLLIIGGEDHRTGADGSKEDNDQRFARLEEWARKHIGQPGKVEYKWSGQVMEPVDYLAFIGRIEKNRDLFVVTGGSGHGLTHGTIAGMIIADMAHGRKNKWEDIYDPLRRAGNYYDLVKYRAGNFAQWFSCLVPGIKDASAIARGEGAIISHGIDHRAIYKDPQGGLHQFSATCPYSKRLVSWNSLEKSWDCPCYGSRYDGVDGHVINGPSNEPLQRIP